MRTENTPTGSSYGQILKSSSIIGGAQAINYIIGLVRTKVVAVLLGPSGVGLVGVYVSTVGLIQTFAQLGINESGVREVAAAAGSKNAEQISQTVKTLRRACWFTGLAGWVLTILLAWPLAQWTFGSTEKALALIVLGSVVLLETVVGGQKALLQGMRRIGDLARLQVAAAVITTLMAVAIYAWLRERGIIPVIILTSVVQLGFSWFFSRRIPLEPVTQPWRETWRNSRQLIKLGSAFMYGALLMAIVGLLTRVLIVRSDGLEAAGIFQAAWALSGMFGSFILSAMATDFYPRLTSVSENNTAIVRLTNEQLEVGVLLSLPGILATIALAPWIIELFYSSEFVAGAELMPWFVVGVFGQVASWPLGMIPMAKAATGWMFLLRTHAGVVRLATVVVFLHFMGLVGVAVGFVVFEVLQSALLVLAGRSLAGFRFTRSAKKLLLESLVVIAAAMAAWLTLPRMWVLVLVLVAALVSGLLSMRRLLYRVPVKHPAASRLRKLLGVAATDTRTEDV
jgi:antigen flippase